MAFIIVILLFFVPVVLYRKIYFKRISCILIPGDCSGPVVVSVKLGRRWFRQIGCGARSGCVSLGSNIKAVYFDRVNGDELIHIYKGVALSGDVYLFKSGFLGKFKSIDLSDRFVIDIVNKLS